MDWNKPTFKLIVIVVSYAQMLSGLITEDAFTKQRENLNELPKDEIPKNIISIDVGYNKIQFIDAEDFMGFEALEIFIARKNKLTSVPNLTYVGNTLLTLDLTSNKLSQVLRDDLKPLTVLEELFLKGTKLTAFPDVFYVGGTLKTLIINDNPIENVSDSEIAVLSVIETLSSCTNGLTKQYNMSNIRTLKKIKTYTNPITGIIPASYFFGCYQLEYISFWDSYITEFPDLRHIATTVELVKLRENLITTVPYHLVHQLVVLERLDLSANPLTKFEHLVPALGPTLTYLLISEVQFTDYPKGLSRRSTNLALFDFHGNNLTVIKPAEFVFSDRNQSVDFTINLDNSYLTALPPPLGLNLNNITIIANAVPFVCDANMAWVFHLPESSLNTTIGTCDKPSQLAGRNLKDVQIAEVKSLHTENSRTLVRTRADLLATDVYNEALPLLTVHTRSVLHCISLCARQPGCLFINYHPTASNTQEENCHYSSAFNGRLMDKPLDTEGWNYYSVTKK